MCRLYEITITNKNGTITITPLIYDDNSEWSLKRYREKNIPLPRIKGFSVNFEGHNEGSGSPCRDSEEVRATIRRLLLKNNSVYKIKIIDKRVTQSQL